MRSAAFGAGSAALVPALTAGRVLAASDPVPAPLKPFEFDEATIGELQQRMASGEISARSLTEAYLQRIDEIDNQKSIPGLNAVIEVNPDALAIAAELDKERKAKGVRGPMHGIPVLIKDNIDTADRMQTTAGSLALGGIEAVAGFGGCEKVARGGCGNSWKNQSQRMGKHALQPFHQRMERPRRADSQSLRARSKSLRIKFRDGSGGLGELVHGWSGNRN